MKNIKIIIVMLLAFSISAVEAKYVKYGNITYLIQEEFSCGNTTVIADAYIEKTGKLKVNDIDENAYIWYENNTCTAFTIQDELDEYNSIYTLSPFRDASDYHIMYHQKTNAKYEIGYVKATGEFDPNQEYYVLDLIFIFPVEEPKEEDFESYYVPIYLKHPESAKVDPSIDYYTQPTHFGSQTQIVDINDVTNETIIDYYVKTTKEELGFTETNSTIGNLQFDMIRGSGKTPYSYELKSFNDVLVIKVFSKDDEIYYYDYNGTELSSFKNYNVEVNGNYIVKSTMDNKKVIVYDANETNIIYEKTYAGDDIFGGVGLTESSVIIHSLIDGKLRSTYINLYKPLDGDNQTFNNDDITIRFNGNFSAFKELRINGAIVPKDKYTVSKGSTIITIKKEYLETLLPGTYNVAAFYIDGGEAKASFVINKKQENTTSETNETKKEMVKEIVEKIVKDETPETLDSINKYSIIGLISLGTLFLSYKFLNKKSKLK